nr:hypothetical protein [Haloglycomyces albus]
MNQGKHVYLRKMTDGQTLHLEVGSDAFHEAVKTQVEAGHGDKIKAELKAFSAEFPDHDWDGALKGLEEAGVFGEAEEAAAA